MLGDGMHLAELSMHFAVVVGGGGRNGTHSGRGDILFERTEMINHIARSEYTVYICLHHVINLDMTSFIKDDTELLRK